MVYLTNAFSIQMLTKLSESHQKAGIDLKMVQIDTEAVKQSIIDAFQFEAVIGHADTAAVISDALNMSIQPNRKSVHLTNLADKLIVAQVVGGRLPEGATTIPEGMELQWWLVYLTNPPLY